MRLKFREPELEKQFIQYYRASARRWVRMSLFVALSSVCGFAIIDHVLLVGPAAQRAPTSGASGCSFRWCSSCWC